MPETASTTSKTSTKSTGKGATAKNGTSTKSNGAAKPSKVEGHGKPIKMNNGALLYNDDRPAGKSGKGGVVVKHGTSTGYQRGCRCDECKAAMASYTTSRREATKGTDAEAEAKKTTQAEQRKARREAKAAEKAAAAEKAKAETAAA